MQITSHQIELIMLKTKQTMLSCLAQSGVQIVEKIPLETKIESYCKELGITVDDFKSQCRKRNLTVARFAAFYVLRFDLCYSTIKLAGLFNRDHTTIVHATQTANDLIECRDEEFMTCFNAAKTHLLC